jgi:hypothetical protein
MVEDCLPFASLLGSQSALPGAHAACARSHAPVAMLRLDAGQHAFEPLFEYDGCVTIIFARASLQPNGGLCLHLTTDTLLMQLPWPQGFRANRRCTADGVLCAMTTRGVPGSAQSRANAAGGEDCEQPSASACWCKKDNNDVPADTRAAGNENDGSFAQLALNAQHTAGPKELADAPAQIAQSLKCAAGGGMKPGGKCTPVGGEVGKSMHGRQWFGCGGAGIVAGVVCNAVWDVVMKANGAGCSVRLHLRLPDGSVTHVHMLWPQGRSGSMSCLRTGHTVVLCGARASDASFSLMPGVRPFEWSAASTKIRPQRPVFDTCLAELKQQGGPLPMWGQPPRLAVNLSACPGLLGSPFLLPETAFSALAATVSGALPIPVLTVVRSATLGLAALEGAVVGVGVSRLHVKEWRVKQTTPLHMPTRSQLGTHRASTSTTCLSIQPSSTAELGCRHQTLQETHARSDTNKPARGHSTALSMKNHVIQRRHIPF